MSERRAVDLVNVFWGSEIFKKQSEGRLSGKWFFYKPQIGNLSPACHLPNAAFSVVPYGGGYPTGYGIYNPSYGAVPTEAVKEKMIKGFTHFCHSGAGFLLNFYNYFMICPAETPQKILSENGGCGWYEAETPAYRAKVALDGVSAYYQFALKQGKTVTILPNFGGLENQSKRCKTFRYPFTGERREDGILVFRVNIDGMPLFFSVASQKKFGIEIADGRYRLNFAAENVSLSVGYSLVSADEACQRVASSCFDYAEAKKRAEDIWQKVLSAVDVKGDERTRTLFYTALYHALKKPCIENFTYPVFDLATVWDMYKTHFPLMSFLYPDKAAAIVNGMSKCFMDGRFYNSKLMELQLRASNQAVSLMPLCIATAYLYGIDADYDVLFPLCKKDLLHHAERSKLLRPYPTHNLDFLDAYYALTACGVEAGEEVRSAAKYRETRLYNKKELLKRGIRRIYYEGTNVNYSFRVSSSAEARLLKCDKARLLKELDRFFGFEGGDVVNFDSPASYRTVLRRGKRYRRFEGLNNEPDMETMYLYHKLGEYGKCEEIVNEVIRYQFHTGNGGLCGNDDSGGLTAWLVWNILGLFPVIGTKEILIGAPQIDEASILLDGKLTIKTVGRGEGKLIKRVLLNGKELAERKTDIATLKRGGELVIEY